MKLLILFFIPSLLFAQDESSDFPKSFEKVGDLFHPPYKEAPLNLIKEDLTALPKDLITVKQGTVITNASDYKKSILERTIITWAVFPLDRSGLAYLLNKEGKVYALAPLESTAPLSQDLNLNSKPESYIAEKKTNSSLSLNKSYPLKTRFILGRTFHKSWINNDQAFGKTSSNAGYLLGATLIFNHQFFLKPGVVISYEESDLIAETLSYKHKELSVGLELFSILKKWDASELQAELIAAYAPYSEGTSKDLKLKGTSSSIGAQLFHEMQFSKFSLGYGVNYKLSNYSISQISPTSQKTDNRAEHSLALLIGVGGNP